MRNARRLWSHSSRWNIAVLCVPTAGLLILQAGEQPPARPTPHVSRAAAAISGEELFRREWIVDDPRSHGGDGLGPVYNDTSCVACHNQGSAGGAGASAKNVDLISAALSTSFEALDAPLPRVTAEAAPAPFTFTPGVPLPSAVGEAETEEIMAAEEVTATELLWSGFVELFRLSLPFRRSHEAGPVLGVVPQPGSLAKVHPGFETARSVVLHRFGTDPGYDAWRKRLFGRAFEESNEIAVPRVEPFAVEAAEPGAAVVARSESGRVGLDFAIRETPAAAQNPGAGPDLPRHPKSLSPIQRSLGRLGRLALMWSDSLLVSAGFDPRMDGGFIVGNNHEMLEPAVRRILLNPDLDAAISDGHFVQQSVEETQAPDGTMQRSVTGVFVRRVERNPTAIFGAGLIDAIPDAAIEAAAARQHPEFPFVSGRVSRQKAGGIGRFGWKGQIESLRQFTMTACAVEVGLHVPEHPQAPSPNKSGAPVPAGFDMSQEECDALVRYLRELPAPKRMTAAHPRIAEYVATGRTLFEQVGCAACHLPRLGEVEGLYSDLLLHDMGEGLSDDGAYGGSLPGDEDSIGKEPLATSDDASGRRPVRGTRSTEWRTPPLWGVAQSSPYLHDGRAATLEEAILFHGGEAWRSNVLFNRLGSTDREKLIAFLKTVGVPGGE